MVRQQLCQNLKVVTRPNNNLILQTFFLFLVGAGGVLYVPNVKEDFCNGKQCKLLFLKLSLYRAGNTCFT